MSNQVSELMSGIYVETSVLVNSQAQMSNSVCVTSESGTNVKRSVLLQCHAQMSNQVCYFRVNQKCRIKFVTALHVWCALHVCFAMHACCALDVVLYSQVCSVRLKHK